MFPFSLSGPDFLLFYGVASLAVFAGLAWWRRVREGGEVPRLDVSDPYPIAYLRDGVDGVLRIATLSLVGRGLLKTEGRRLCAVSAAASTTVPVEQALIARFREPAPAAVVFGDPGLQRACKPYDDLLTQLRLLPDAALKAARNRAGGAALWFLWGLAAVRILLSLAGGHGNVLFLVMLAAFSGWLCLRFARHPRRTRLGDLTLNHLTCLVAAGGRRAVLAAILGTPGRRAASGPLDPSVLLLAAILGTAVVLTVAAKARELGLSSAGIDGGSGDGGGGDGGGGGGCGGCGGCGGGS